MRTYLWIFCDAMRRLGPRRTMICSKSTLGYFLLEFDVKSGGVTVSFHSDGRVHTVFQGGRERINIASGGGSKLNVRSDDDRFWLQFEAKMWRRFSEAAKRAGKAQVE